jgi:hypothetical protein
MSRRRRVQLTEKLFMMVGGRMTRAEAEALAAAQRAANGAPVAVIERHPQSERPPDTQTDPAPQ